jgi:hypothetical protein
MELGLDRGQVGKDVGVIVLEVIQDRRARAIVHELRALVGERGVVFVGLDHEERALRQSCRDAEVHRHAADQEPRVEAGVIENPRQERGGRGLAVRPGHRQYPFVAQHGICKPLRSRAIRTPAIENRLEQRIAARDRVADHEHVRCLRDTVELLRFVAFVERDAERGELRAHRRIDVGVAAGDGVPRRARDRGYAAHERPADAEDVQMHGRDAQAAFRASARWYAASSERV